MYKIERIEKLSKVLNCTSKKAATKVSFDLKGSSLKTRGTVVQMRLNKPLRNYNLHLKQKLS